MTNPFGTALHNKKLFENVIKNNYINNNWLVFDIT